MSKVKFGLPGASDDQANAAVTGIRAVMRDDFNGAGTGVAAIDPTLWDVVLDPTMTAAAGASALVITTDTSAGTLTTLTSKQSFWLPVRAIFAWRQSVAKQLNQGIRLELVAVNPDGTLDEGNRAYFESRLNIATATALYFNTVTDGIVGTPTAITGVNASTADQLLELAFDADQMVASYGTMNAAARSGFVCRDNNLPRIDRTFKVRISVINDVGFVGVANAFSIYYCTALDMTEVQAEITGSRGAGNTVQVSGAVTASGAVALVPSSASGVGSFWRLVAVASVNANLVNTGATTLAFLFASNLSAAWRHVKLYNKATTPVPGTDTPVIVIPVPPGGTVMFNPANCARFSAGLGVAITANPADADATAVAAGDVVLSAGFA